MRLTVNGAPLDVPEGCTLPEALAAAGLDDLRGVAIALDDQVVPRSEWPSAQPADGQRIEVVRAVQGGQS